MRFHVPTLKDDPDGMEAFADRLAGVPGIVHVIARPHTASLILECSEPTAQVARRLVAEGLTKPLRAVPAIPVSQAVQFAMAGLDETVRKNSDGALDARTAIAIALIGAAFFQMARGNLIGPAATLLMSALPLIDKTLKK